MCAKVRMRMCMRIRAQAQSTQTSDLFRGTRYLDKKEDWSATRHVLQHLTVDNCVVFVIHRGAQKIADHHEKWFGTAYRVIKLPVPHVTMHQATTLPRSLLIS